MEPDLVNTNEGRLIVLSFIRSCFGPRTTDPDLLSKVNVIANIAINPHGEQSTAEALKPCLNLLRRKGLNPRLHACGTNVEGPWSDVAEAVRACHELLHKRGVKKVSTDLHLSTRTDKRDSIATRLA